MVAHYSLLFYQLSAKPKKNKKCISYMKMFQSKLATHPACKSLIRKYLFSY